MRLKDLNITLIGKQIVPSVRSKYRASFTSNRKISFVEKGDRFTLVGYTVNNKEYKASKWWFCANFRLAKKEELT